ncbi:3-hydroxyacyl-ACP dehydratase FabZ [Aminobacterium colombiense]|jgi:3-hydroxyacyl-[acyl-carrier-protein] dehydratase|uniref:3-hydroxyacyl-[acyl-carrier-protein] dehydratase FabZ n=1 Tax=Aminobacterium colombiense (strain DSM 12261 / ALA-1) TaxID=572547 RepID=D5EGD8_AMICL|nr:3-hydroxyacyl-ACP dehydratase FabZ [Aminobacterium colombiense]ADE57620.1 beta-hydroxyacyl-(acyl-carrier-protein) dehydratase FabZ [Aminobacterium colombiense DSM 12261]
MIDIDKIMKALPHRYPFLLVDRILEVGENRVVGLKNVSINEPFFTGHFPDEPVMPGVLILEAMGQVAAMMIVCRPNMQNMVTYLTGVDKARFRRPVRPGDQLITTAEMVKSRGLMGKVKARSGVDGELAAEAEYSFFMAERLSKKEAMEERI